MQQKRKIRKVNSLLILCVLSLAVISQAVDYTYALTFSDDETSINNQINVTTLDITLTSNQEDFSEGFDDLFEGDSVTRDVTVGNIGELPVLYRLEYAAVSDPTNLCTELDLAVTEDSTTVYSGPLSGFVTSSFGLAFGSEETYLFEIAVPADAPYEISSSTCVFNIRVVAWQEDFVDETLGFWDEEVLENTVSTGDWDPTTPTGIRILNHEGEDLGCGGIVNHRFITIDWDDNTEFDFDHYDYRIREGTIIAHPTVSEFSGNIRDEDGEYMYSVRAVDTGGHFSDWTDWCYVTLDRTIEEADEGDVIINEIMWMGSTVSGSDEWIELYNDTDDDINLKDWVIENSEGSDLVIPDGYSILAHGYFLIANFSQDDSDSALSDSNVDVDWVTTDVGLDDDGEGLVLKDPFGHVIDEVEEGSWPKGEDGIEKKSMERDDDQEGWHTCIDDECNDTTYWDAPNDEDGLNFGTPRAENHSENDPSDEKDDEKDTKDDEGANSPQGVSGLESSTVEELLDETSETSGSINLEGGIEV